MRATIQIHSPLKIAAKVLVTCFVVVGIAVAIKLWMAARNGSDPPAVEAAGILDERRSK